ncbi:NADH-quinone oxidoreductase subunit L [Kyrpidia spormannii]|uniref:NADH-quinone oxidoreductase subunit L n=1 Tax=Kyrpidia spormannii TaxID=2055160 RepID=A0ACA8ZE40_9BACL|nr:NADH-quinone oxidoreductase subunit L [Kyrpidia spormannii]CAB3395651.1 NADH-quinone oxidoreductase subunit L [Kyrpidia spormannii]
MIAHAWLVPAVPLIGYLLLLAMGRRVHEGVAASIGVVATLISLVLSLMIFGDVARGGGQPPYLWNWLTFGPGPAHTWHVGFEVNPLNALMLVVVSFVSTLVLLFSRGYMHGDPRFGVFYQYLLLFVFSMLGLVISPNFLQLYVFWELVGLCSYLLVGFWYYKPEAAAAAKKSFVVTRLGDVGLLAGIILLYLATGSFDYEDIARAVQSGNLQVGWISAQGMATLGALLIFFGAVGKSAQFPLHVWLPDAMEGPTPVSALIHAATMVAAGVYLVARAFPLFAFSPAALHVVAYIGGITAILGAAIGLTQRDIKRVIAYSTISQLGYMMMGLGVAAYTAGVFHLFTHAFFKALLFLAAGSVIHAVDTQDLDKMGGLWRRMPMTAWTFLFGALALSGIPPFAGFWSKDDILAATLAAGQPVLYVLGTVAAFFTAFYIFRVFFLTFTGRYRGERIPRESGWVMTLPLMILALMALGAGVVGAPFAGFPLERFLGEPTEAMAVSAGPGVMALSTVVGLLGIGLAWLMYGKKSVSAKAWSRALSPLYNLSFHKFYFDELYQAVIVRPVFSLGRVFDWVDRWIIDGIVTVIGGGTKAASSGLRRIQTGQVQTYGLITLLGIVALIAVSWSLLWGVHS